MQRDEAPAEQSRSESREPTKGSVVGGLLWKPTPCLRPLYSLTGQSQWRREKEETGRRRTRGMKGRVETTNKQLCKGKTGAACHGERRPISQRLRARLRWDQSQDRAYITFCQSMIDTKEIASFFQEISLVPLNCIFYILESRGKLLLIAVSKTNTKSCLYDK